MYDFSLIGANCGEVAKREAIRTLAMGLPITGWDRELNKIIKTYPDGRIEVLGKATIILANSK